MTHLSRILGVALFGIAIIAIGLIVTLMFRPYTLLQRAPVRAVSDELRKGQAVDVNPDGTPIDYFACRYDYDCQIVTASECGCPLYDSYTSINRKYESQWTNRQSLVFEACPTGGQVGSVAPSCAENVKAKCVKRECRLVR